MMDDTMEDAYIDLEERVKAVPIEATEAAFNTHLEHLEESTSLVKNARSTEEVIQDAYVVSSITASIHNSTKCINVAESNFDSEIFARAILNLVENTTNDQREPNWAVLAAKSAHIYKYAPGFTYINGFGENQEAQMKKVVEKKERQARKPLEQRKEPEKVKTITKTVEGVSAVESIGKILNRSFRRNGEKPLCFFQFVIDPQSFSKTVENIFHLSFLAHDGLVDISLDPDTKLPLLTPLPAQGTVKASQINKIQMLPSITIPQWQEIIRTFEITEAMLP